MKDEKNIFFVTGLPRSRTAWLANFLTHEQSFCLHEITRRDPDPARWPGILDALPFAAVGSADSGFIHHYEKALKLFPKAKLVIIERDPREACRSFARYLPGLIPDAGQWPLFEMLQTKLQALIAAVPGALRVRYEDLASERICETIWQHCCPGQEFDPFRWQELDKLNVQVRQDVALAEARATQPSAPISVPPGRRMLLETEYNGLLAELCQKTPGALHWLLSLWEILLTWDHIEDGDPVDKAMANRAFESLMLYWPQNPFFQAHKEQLLPVMFNAISAWRHSNNGGPPNKGWDMYTEAPCTVAAIIGGMAAVNQYMPRLRDLAEQLRGEDDKEDT